MPNLLTRWDHKEQTCWQARDSAHHLFRPVRLSQVSAQAPAPADQHVQENSRRAMSSQNSIQGFKSAGLS